MLSVLMTSIMKSEPGRSLTRSSTGAGRAPVSRATAASEGTAALACWAPVCGAAAAGRLVAIAPAPAAAPFRKPRLPRELFLDFVMVSVFPDTDDTSVYSTHPKGAKTKNTKQTHLDPQVLPAEMLTLVKANPFPETAPPRRPVIHVRPNHTPR